MHLRRSLLPLLAVALLWAASGWSLGKPDWATPYLDRPTPSGGYIAAADSWVVVYGEIEFGLRGERSIVESCRLLLENVSGSPQSFELSLVYDAGLQELADVALNVQRRLWHTINLKRTAVTASVPGSAETLFASAEKIEAGRRVSLEFSLRDRLGFNPWLASIVPRDVPVAEIRYLVDPGAANRGLRMRLVTTDGGEAPATFTRDGELTWTVREIPAYQRIRPLSFLYQPVATDLFPFFLVVAEGTPGESFSAYARHYRRAWNERLATIDAAQVAAEVEELTASRESWRERAERLTAFVQQGIQYDDSNVKSTESWVPLTTQETLRSRKADCKGKVMLLQALLAASGLQAAPVLLRSESRYFTWREDVGTAFMNHVVLAVRPPEGAEPLPGALLEGPLAGWVLVDPTVETAAFGLPMPGYEGVPGLAIADVADPVFTIRTRSPAVARTRVTVRWELAADGSARVRASAVDNGSSALLVRATGASSEDEVSRRIAEALLEHLSAVTMQRCELRRPVVGRNGNTELELRFAAAHTVQELSSSLLAEGPLAVAATLAALPNGYRAAARPESDEVVELEAPWDARRNTSGVHWCVDVEAVLVLPPGLEWTPPAAVEEQRPWVSFRCAWEPVDEHTFSATVHFEVPRGEWPAAERRERLKLMDRLLSSLYAPHMVKRPAGS